MQNPLILDLLQGTTLVAGGLPPVGSLPPSAWGPVLASDVLGPVLLDCGLLLGTSWPAGPGQRMPGMQ